MNEIKPGRRVVGRDGPPTPETAPWGVRVWGHHGSYVWTTPETAAFDWLPNTEWEPLPEPSSEYVSAPEPESAAQRIAAYVSTHLDFPKFTAQEAAEEAIRVVLNDEGALRDVVGEASASWVQAIDTLDRDGVAYGPGRPADQLDGTMGYVLYRYGKQVGIDFADYLMKRPRPIDCWWPLPVPEDTNAG